MKLLMNLCTSLTFLILYCNLSGKGIVHSCKIQVSNKCPFPIWPATASNTGQPVIANGGFYLASGTSHKINVPGNWVGRIWARTGCNFDTCSNNNTCETGDCEGRLECNGLIGAPPVTLIQFALQVDKNQPSFFDVSIVDGYNLPVSVWAAKTTGTEKKSKSCRIGGCLKDLKSICPVETQVINGEGEVVACKSACLAFGVDKFCCRNEYRSADKCKPTLYSKLFKDACPWYYSYAFDTPAPLVSCMADDFFVTFCPNKWGSNEHYTDLYLEGK